jgi:hypothetical protein
MTSCLHPEAMRPDRHPQACWSTSLALVDYILIFKESATVTGDCCQQTWWLSLFDAVTACLMAVSSLPISLSSAAWQDSLIRYLNPCIETDVTKVLSTFLFLLHLLSFVCRNLGRYVSSTLHNNRSYLSTLVVLGSGSTPLNHFSPSNCPWLCSSRNFPLLLSWSVHL